MNRLQAILLFSLIFISSFSWFMSKDQPDMMYAMMTYDPKAIVLFIASWTAGMAAMMFPSISPMVLFYGKLIKKHGNGNVNGSRNKIKKKDDVQTSFASKCCNKIKAVWNRKTPFTVPYVVNISLFTGCYLIVWTATGLMLLLVWSIPMNAWVVIGIEKKQVDIVYGMLLIISGAYQFTHLKVTCIRYCESPLSFFMRRWKSGTKGAVKMGLYHGLYCLGCCWPYFLLMVAMGWMGILWMGLFAGIIFAEKVWSKGIYVSKTAGIVFMVMGLIIALGMISINDFSGSNLLPKNNMSDDKMTILYPNPGDNGITKNMVMDMKQQQ
jgi:predicted metal-binding membrane protein